MRRMVLGIAVCCGISGVNGMDTTLIDSIISNPSDRSVLTKIVSEVINDNQKTLQARSYIHSKIDGLETEELTSNELNLYRICSMLYQLSRDIRSDEVNSLNYYVYGVYNGNFEPYFD